MSIIKTTFNNYPVSYDTETQTLDVGFGDFGCGVFPDITTETQVYVLAKNSLYEVGFDGDGKGRFQIDTVEYSSCDVSVSFKFRDGTTGHASSLVENPRDYLGGMGMIELTSQGMMLVE